MKTVKIKNTSREWFDWEIAEKLSLRKKLFKKFKSSRLSLDWEDYKEARNDVHRLIKYKNKKCFEEKLAENYSKFKKTLAGIKTTRITKQKNFAVKYLLKKFRWFIIRLILNSRSFSKILLITSRKPCFEATKAAK